MLLLIIFLINDLEKPAFECSPLLASIKSDIMHSGVNYNGVMMSGSGTSIYGLAKAENLEDKIQGKIDDVLSKNPGLKFYECKFIGRDESVESWY